MLPLKNNYQFICPHLNNNHDFQLLFHRYLSDEIFNKDENQIFTMSTKHSQTNSTNLPIP